MKKNSENIKEREKLSRKESFKETLPYIIVILIVILIRTFIATPVKVNGTSMINTLKHGDTMILNKIGKKFNSIKRFQIVVIKTKDSYLIKRVIGLPGETIKYEVSDNNTGTLYVNNKKVEEAFLDDKTKTLTCTNETELCTSGVKVPSGYYYVMGDNRGNSIDSRILGFIDKKDITGTTKLIIFPIKDIGIAK